MEARAQRHRTLPDSGAPPLHFRREDDDDEHDDAPDPSTSGNPQVQPRFSGGPPTSRSTDATPTSTSTSAPFHATTLNGCDQSSAVYFFSNEFDQSAVCDFSNGEDGEIIRVNNEEGEIDRDFLNGEWTNGEWFHQKVAPNLSEQGTKSLRKAFLSVKTLRRILNAKESIFKYGVFVPRNDKD